MLILGTFCGTSAKGLTVTSSGNTLLLQLISDSSVGDKGVKISWEAIPRVALTDTSE